jgi:hypothetical protein
MEFVDLDSTKQKLFLHLESNAVKNIKNIKMS